MRRNHSLYPSSYMNIAAAWEVDQIRWIIYIYIYIYLYIVCVVSLGWFVILQHTFFTFTWRKSCHHIITRSYHASWWHCHIIARHSPGPYHHIIVSRDLRYHNNNIIITFIIMSSYHIWCPFRTQLESIWDRLGAIWEAFGRINLKPGARNPEIGRNC